MQRKTDLVRLSQKNTLMQKLILLLLFISGFQSIAQTTGKVVDASTGESIPFANIQCDNSLSLVSNAEGFFTISQTNADDVRLTVSYLGFVPVQLTVGELKSKPTVSLHPSVYELDEVKVKERPSPEVIMSTVKKYLKTNYPASTKNYDSKIFMRQSNVFTPKKLDIEIEKSTGFTKNNLKAFNQEIEKFTSVVIAHPPKEYTDILFNYYGAPQKKVTKIAVAKATKLRDENRSASIEGMEKNATAMFLKHLDTTKYYRIKSGWFGSRDTVSLRKDFRKDKKSPPRNEMTSLRSNLNGVLTDNSILSKDFEFVHDPGIYEYKLEGSVLLPDGDFAYVLTFKPRKNRAIFTGKLYVAESDFAVLRADYALAEGKKGEGMNLKLLLGVKFSENLKSGTMIFKKRPSGDGYYLQYASNEHGQYFYVNRPLKFIELSDSEKDVVAFNFKIEGNVYEKTEYLNLSRIEISDADFEAAKESNFKYASIKKYDSELWKDESAIEPLEEMKRFKVSDEPQ